MKKRSEKKTPLPPRGVFSTETTAKLRKVADNAGRKETAQEAVGPPAEAFAGLADWADEVAGCLTRGELRALIDVYRKIARDGRVSAANRRLARKQAQALKKKI